MTISLPWRRRPRRVTARTPVGLVGRQSEPSGDDWRARGRRVTARTPAGLVGRQSEPSGDDWRARGRRVTARTPAGIGWAPIGAVRRRLAGEGSPCNGADACRIGWAPIGAVRRRLAGRSPASERPLGARRIGLRGRRAARRCPPGRDCRVMPVLLTVLGSGSAGNATLLQCGETRVLIDVGAELPGDGPPAGLDRGGARERRRRRDHPCTRRSHPRRRACSPGATRCRSMRPRPPARSGPTPTSGPWGGLACDVPTDIGGLSHHPVRGVSRRRRRDGGVPHRDGGGGHRLRDRRRRDDRRPRGPVPALPPAGDGVQPREGPAAGRSVLGVHEGAHRGRARTPVERGPRPVRARGSRGHGRVPRARPPQPGQQPAGDRGHDVPGGSRCVGPVRCPGSS